MQGRDKAILFAPSPSRSSECPLMAGQSFEANA
jgi:hypothetical protein